MNIVIPTTRGPAVLVARLFLGIGAALLSCSPPQDAPARAAEPVTLRSEVTFPSAGTTPIAAGTDSIDVAQGTSGLLFAWRAPASAGLTQRFDRNWVVTDVARRPAMDAVAVAVAPRVGGFVAAWTTSTASIQAANLDAAGAITGTTATLASRTGIDPALPPALGTTTRGAIIAWVDGSTPGTWSIRVARMDATGAVAPAGGAALATASTLLTNVAIACRASGCLVAWNGSDGLASDDAYVRRVDADGTPLDAALRVASALRARVAPRVATSGVHDLVVWNEFAPGTTAPGVYARRFDSTSGAWLDPAEVRVRTLRADASADYRSDVAWNGRDYAVVTTHGTRLFDDTTLRVVSASNVLGALTVIPPSTILNERLRLIGDLEGWSAVSNGSVQHLEFAPDGTFRSAAPVVDNASIPQTAYGLAWAGDRFYVGVTEGLWRVTASGVRDGAAPTEWPPHVLDSQLNPSRTFPLRLLASGARLAISVGDRSTGSALWAFAGFTDSTLATFSPITRQVAALSARVLGAGGGANGGFLFGVGAQDGLSLAATRATGEAVYSTILPDATLGAAWASTSTRTLVARLRQRTVGAADVCARELVLLDAAGSAVGIRTLDTTATMDVCRLPPNFAVATDGTSFLWTHDQTAEIVRGDDAITSVRTVTWPSGEIVGAVWSGDDWVLINALGASPPRRLVAFRISATGVLRDGEGVPLGTADYAPLINPVHTATDGAGHVAVLFPHPTTAGAVRAALRIVDWRDELDGGTPDAGSDSAVDVASADATTPPDAARDVGTDASDAPPPDTAAPDGAASDAPGADASVLDAASPEDVRSDVVRDGADDRPVDAPADVSVDAPVDAHATDASPAPPPGDGGGCNAAHVRSSLRAPIALLAAAAVLARRRRTRR